MRTTLQGVVTSDKCDKTRRVEVKRLYRHPKYGKIVSGRTVCHVHDEQNDAHEGDTVEIIECRPRSKQKRWELVKVLERSKLVKRTKGDGSSKTPQDGPSPSEVTSPDNEAAATMPDESVSV